MLATYESSAAERDCCNGLRALWDEHGFVFWLFAFVIPFSVEGKERRLFKSPFVA